MDSALKPQELKSKETRDKLIQATLDALQEFGYHGASLSKILAKAGVSKGGWQHHFQNKKEMVAVAAEHILKGAIDKTQDIASQIKNKQNPLHELFDFIWITFYTGKHRAIWLEFNVASRTDEELRDRLVPVLEAFHESMSQSWKDYFTTTDKHFSIETILNLTIYALRGMALQSIAYEKPEYYKQLRDEWIKIIRPYIQLK